MFQIRHITHEQIWDQFLLLQPEAVFVQSSIYGELYDSLDEKHWVIGIYKNNELVGGSLVVSVHAKRGAFLFLPYGPVLDASLTADEVNEARKVLFSYLTAFARDREYDFIRVSPFTLDSDIEQSFYREQGFRPAPMHILAETTWILNVKEGAEGEILGRMNKNHRNLIRRCRREGVEIKMSTDLKDLSVFDDMLTETAERHSFVRFSQSYIEKEFKAFAGDKHVAIFFAYLPDGRLDAAAVIFFFGKMAAYRHSASRNLDRRLPTSYALQWRIIQEAQKRGMTWYNFWGIAPDGASKKHPFFGITHFKKGFGGEKRQLLHCQDMPITKTYWLNWLVESYRRLRRGF